MRPRGSVTGPLIIILIGVIFLIHSFSPQFRIADLLILYWPYLLIVWGAVALLEVCVRFLRGRTVPVNGVSGVAWFIIVLICLVGVSAFEIHRPGNHWWQETGWGRGFSDAFGEEHDYSVGPIQKSVGASPHVIIEAFRGDARIVGSDGSQISVSGHKTIRTLDGPAAERTNSDTPVDVVVQGNTVIIRCNQDRAGSRTRVTTDLDVSVPKGASVEATGNSGDFDVSGVSGDVDLSSANAGIRLQDLDGNVKVDTRRSDLVRCTNVKGNVDLRGHGGDVELTKIGGQVTVTGDYSGTVSLRELAKAVRIENMRTQLEVQQIPGELRVDRGSLTAQSVIGPLKLAAHATDISLAGFTNAVQVTIDRGDLELRPERVPLGKMDVRIKSGNIDLTLPESAQFALAAGTDHGEIENEFGTALSAHTEKLGSRLDGSVGTGPDLALSVGRGNITIRKGAVAEAAPTKVTSVSQIRN
jgi:DUF4097 and DUF4098 domain-containing protein YvlB